MASFVEQIFQIRAVRLLAVHHPRFNQRFKPKSPRSSALWRALPAQAQAQAQAQTVQTAWQRWSWPRPPCRQSATAVPSLSAIAVCHRCLPRRASDPIAAPALSIEGRAPFFAFAALVFRIAKSQYATLVSDRSAVKSQKCIQIYQYVTINSCLKPTIY